MSTYLKDFKVKISKGDYSLVKDIWDEYIGGFYEQPDAEEFKQVLLLIRDSSLAPYFGKHMESDALFFYDALPKEEPATHEVFKLIYDIQDTHSRALRDRAIAYIEHKYSGDEFSREKLRLTGLSVSDAPFQGAISNFELLTHMKPGNFVFHKGGWGVGEIKSISYIREKVSAEFEESTKPQDLSFHNAFKFLTPLPKEHFLAQRFGNPDELEKKAMANPLEVIRMLLRDLGPQSAAEIKHELIELVIPAEPADVWQRWWQTARTKIKKDPLIHFPSSADSKDKYYIRPSAITPEEELQLELEKKPNVKKTIHLVYQFLRDNPKSMKNEAFKHNLSETLKGMLSSHKLAAHEELQILYLIDDLSVNKEPLKIKSIIQNSSPIEKLVESIETLSFKKRALQDIKEVKTNWQQIYFALFLSVDHSAIKDFIISTLVESGGADVLKEGIEKLIKNPAEYPETFIWYFGQVMKDPSLPLGDHASKVKLLETLLILAHRIQRDETKIGLTNKIHSLITADSYALAREIYKLTNVEQIKEILRYASVCLCFSEHEYKSLHSLAEVIHPGIKKDIAEEEETGIWITQEGNKILRDQIHQISEVDMKLNVKRIAAAKSLGDLKENQEYKAALQEQSLLNIRLKDLLNYQNTAKMLTPNLVKTDKISIGSVVTMSNPDGETVSITILGPIEADPERFIYNHQTNLCQSILGKKVGDKVQFNKKECTITSITSYFDKK